jgi:hypothetical protein
LSPNTWDTFYGCIARETHKEDSFGPLEFDCVKEKVSENLSPDIGKDPRKSSFLLATFVESTKSPQFFHLAARQTTQGGLP